MAERVYESIEVDAPVQQVYRYWQNLENLPRFMSNIEEVRSTGPDTTHWRVKGPLGAELEFDARTTRDEPDQAIGWYTVDGNVQTSGQVRFRELGADRTRVDVTMNYWDLPGGRIGDAASRVIANPKVMIEQDLRNFKEIIEGTVTPEEIRQRRPARSRPRPGGEGPNLGAIRLLDEWMADDSGYDEEVLPELKEALDRDRPGHRKLFG